MSKKKRIKEQKRKKQQEEMAHVMKVLYDQYAARVKAKKIEPPPYKSFCDMFVMGYDASRADNVQGKINDAVQAILETNMVVHQAGSPREFMKDRMEDFDKTMREKANDKADADRLKKFETTFMEQIYEKQGSELEDAAGPEGQESPEQGTGFAEEDTGQNIGGISPY